MLKSRKLRLFDYLETLPPNVTVQVKSLSGKPIKRGESYTMKENTDEDLLQSEVIYSCPMLVDGTVEMHYKVRKSKATLMKEGAKRNEL